MKLQKAVEKLNQKNKLEDILRAIIGHLSWDKFMLAMSNICFFKADNFRNNGDKENYKKWMKRARMFHDEIEN